MMAVTKKPTARFKDRALLRSTLAEYSAELEEAMAECETCADQEDVCEACNALSQRRQVDYAALTLGMLHFK